MFLIFKIIFLICCIQPQLFAVLQDTINDDAIAMAPKNISDVRSFISPGGVLIPTKQEVNLQCGGRMNEFHVEGITNIGKTIKDWRENMYATEWSGNVFMSSLG